MQPHEMPSVMLAGRSPGEAAGVMVLMHGRGAGASDILRIASLIDRDDLAYAAPEAPGGTWYPKPFLAPKEENEPDLSSALGVIDSLIRRFTGRGTPAGNIFLLGFSQGACLVLEYAARNPARYGGVFGLSGGLIGAPGALGPYAGNLGGTPVYLGCSENDPHIPRDRVLETRDILTGLGAAVRTTLFDDSTHAVREEEIDAVRSVIDGALGG